MHDLAVPRGRAGRPLRRLVRLLPELCFAPLRRPRQQHCHLVTAKALQEGLHVRAVLDALMVRRNPLSAELTGSLI